MSLNTQILIAAIFGVAFGFLLNLYPHSQFFDSSLYLLALASSIFIGSLKMLIVPLIFSSIVVGVSNLEAGGQFSRVWKITFLCFITTTTLALGLGLLCAHLFEVGKGIDVTSFASAMQAHQTTDSLNPTVILDQLYPEHLDQSV